MSKLKNNTKLTDKKLIEELEKNEVDHGYMDIHQFEELWGDYEDDGYEDAILSGSI